MNWLYFSSCHFPVSVRLMELVEAAGVCIPPLNTSCRAMSLTFKAVLIDTLLSCISLLTVILNLLVIISISHFRQ